MGVEQKSNNELLCENYEQNAEDILAVIGNKTKNAKYEAAILNSALSLYISKKAPSLLDGLELAKKTLDTGLVLEKFNQIKNFYS